MSSILKVIEKLKLNALNIEDVPESFSSDVYKLTLASGETVFVKIPFNKDKLFREFQMLETLKDIIPVPKVLDIWYGDESTTGALLLSAIQGMPCTGEVDEKLSYEIGVYLAMLHEVRTPGYGYHVTDGFKLLDQNNWRLHIKRNFEKWKEPCKQILDSKFQSIRPMLALERVLPFYDFYDAFCAVVWCKNRGIEKNQTFLQENIVTLRNSVGY